MRTWSQNWIKPIIGILLIILLIVPVISWELTNNHNIINELTGVRISDEVIGMMILGIFLGYVFARSNLSFSGAFRKIVQHGDGRSAKAVIVLFMLCSIMAGVAMIVFGPTPFAKPLQNPIGVGTIVGSLLFGFGLILATGGASGTLVNIGKGVVPAVVALIFFLLGSAVGVAFYDSPLDIKFLPEGTNTSIGFAINSMVGGTIINILILSLVLVIVVFVHKYRAYRQTQYIIKHDQLDYHQFGDFEISQETNIKTFFSYQTWNKVFKKRWSFAMGIFALNFWFLITVFVFKKSPALASACAHWGVEITQGFGNEKISSFNDDWIAMNDSQTWQDIGVIVGVAVAQLFANKFKLSGWKDQKLYNWFLYALGGLLIGIGGRINRGLMNMSMFSGLTFQTGFGWTATFFLSIGAITACIFIKKIRHHTPKHAYPEYHK